MVRARSLNVLIAEDDELNRLLIREILESNGHHCLVAADGKEALDLYRSESVDVAFLDLHMPRMDGSDVVRRIRELEQNRSSDSRLPIAVMSADSLDDGGRSYGFDASLEKPYTPESVIRLLARLKEMDVEELSAGNQPPLATSVSTAPDARNAPTDPAVLDEPLLLGPAEIQAVLSKTNHDLEFLSTLVMLFAVDAKDTIDRIDRALAVGDRAVVARHAHVLKSQFAIFSAAAAMALAGQLECDDCGTDAARVTAWLRDAVDRIVATFTTLADDKRRTRPNAKGGPS